MLLVTILLCASSQQLDVAKEQLFMEWTTSSQIPNVTFGLPSEEEVRTVASQLERIRSEIILATAGNLSTTQREIDVPFLLAMIDGIAMEYSVEQSAKCVEHLSLLNDGFTGIAASRVLRMRLRAAMILGDQVAANNARNAFSSLQHPHPEDATIIALFDIQQSFGAGDVLRARKLYDRQASRLNRKKTQYLRVPFANGYARVAPTTDEALHGWFSLAECLVEQGYNHKAVDCELVKWMNRLPNPVNISEESNDSRIALLAIRLEIADTLQSNNTGALEQLIVLARAGDGRAAEQILEQGESDFSEEALDLLFQFPNKIRYSIDYWHLYAAGLDVAKRNLEQALKRLSPIAESEGEYQSRAIEMINQIQGMEVATIYQAFGTSSDEGIPTTLKGEFTPFAMQGLLQQSITLCHTEGVHEWNRATLEILLTNSNGVAPVLLAEAYRLLGNCEGARPLFREAIRIDGPSVQAIAGLADCNRDRQAMQLVVNSTSPDDSSSYWYWMSNVRLLQWFLEDGGNKVEANAKVNRLRKKDASLGGAMFISQFNSICR